MSYSPRLTPIIPYASSTTNRRNLDGLLANGWRLLFSCAYLDHLGRLPVNLLDVEYALDNGAWTAHQKCQPFDFVQFQRGVTLLGHRARFVVAPDVVGGGLDSLDLSVKWLPWCLGRTSLVLLAVQDGMHPRDLDFWVCPHRVGVFLGGTTEWKLATLDLWGSWAKQRAVYFHVGRVNTKKRLVRCVAAQAASFDGSGPAKWAKHRARMDRWLDEIEQTQEASSETPHPA